jgi:hypothetical protein
MFVVHHAARKPARANRVDHGNLCHLAGVSNFLDVNDRASVGTLENTARHKLFDKLHGRPSSPAQLLQRVNRNTICVFVVKHAEDIHPDATRGF